MLAVTPYFPDAEVRMSYYMATDAVYHMMLTVCGELRRVGASEDEIKRYRYEAVHLDNPWSATARWVTTG